jgi:hypothetical protein
MASNAKEKKCEKRKRVVLLLDEAAKVKLIQAVENGEKPVDVSRRTEVCSKCFRSVHAICSTPVQEEGFGMPVICNLCKK